MKTAGKSFEEDFTDRWNALGKTAWVYRFVDASDLYGLNKRIVNDIPKPADFLVGLEGNLSLVEAKSTADPKGFRVSLIRRAQWIAATKSVVAKTAYFFVIKKAEQADWYWVPAEYMLKQKGTIAWGDLSSFLWPWSQRCPTSIR